MNKHPAPNDALNNDTANDTTSDTTNAPSDELMELQIAVAHLEVTVDTLSQVISRQDKQITDLQRQLQLLYGQLERQADSGIAPFDLLADRPPHY